MHRRFGHEYGDDLPTQQHQGSHDDSASVDDDAVRLLECPDSAAAHAGTMTVEKVALTTGATEREGPGGLRQLFPHRFGLTMDVANDEHREPNLGDLGLLWTGAGGSSP